uniref:Uncharacterized protein n=1 Tax=Arundo donax TaxID=35708 RepID=A0A0A9HR93_ARUDO
MDISCSSTCFHSLQTQPMGCHVNVRIMILIIPIRHLRRATRCISDSYCRLGFCVSGY